MSENTPKILTNDLAAHEKRNFKTASLVVTVAIC